MSKHNITLWWLLGGVALAAGSILLFPSGVALLAHLEPFTPATWENLMPDEYAKTMVTLVLLGGICAGAGIGTQTAAWMGAVLNTRHLTDKRWSKWLLWAGIAGLVTLPLFGLGALISETVMIAYLACGPDAMNIENTTTLGKAAIEKYKKWGLVAMGLGTVFSLLVAGATNPGRLLHGFVWVGLTLEMLGITIAGAGAVAVCVAWWGSRFNKHQHGERRTAVATAD